MSALWTQRFCTHPLRVNLISGGTKRLRPLPRNHLHQSRFLAIYKSRATIGKSQICTISHFGLIPGGNDTALRPQVDRSAQRSTLNSSLEVTDLWGSCCNTRTRSRNVPTNHPSIPWYPLDCIHSDSEDSLSGLLHHLYGAASCILQSVPQILRGEGMIDS